MFVDSITDFDCRLLGVLKSCVDVKLCQMTMRRRGGKEDKNDDHGGKGFVFRCICTPEKLCTQKV